MRKLRTISRFLLLALLLGASTFALPACATDSAKLKALFQNPPREYSTGPLWVWNDMLTEAQIRDTLRDLAAQKVKQVWVHPRPGLMTPYLSADWFRLWKVALQEAERLDMNVWIYDENSYPSGFAGGWLPELMPEARGRGLTFRESKTCPQWAEVILGVYRLEAGGFTNVSAQVKAGAALPEARFLVATQVRTGSDAWHANHPYVNLLSPGVTEKFLEVTMEPYRREIGGQFGKCVPGVFTDEPNINPTHTLPWSEILVQEFQKRWGYNLLDHLPSLTQPVGDWRKIRHNYYQVLNEQFIEHWARPNHDYCEKNHLEWTGHYWDHEWPNCSGVPDNMAMYAWHQRPAIDCLMNQYAEHTHSQFGNLRMPRELSSVANQLGMKRTLVEAYGAGGWDLRFEDMKRIGDWLEVFGVNTINQHLSYVTLRGARKRDHPQSFSYHEPWWEAYHVSAEYLARVSAALSQGEQTNRVLVLEPTTTAWMYQGDAAKLAEIGDAFFKLLQALEAAQIDYDIGDEDIIARHGSAEGHELRVGLRSYREVICPPLTENLNEHTRKLLTQAGQSYVLPAVPRKDGALDRSAEAAFQSMVAETRTNLALLHAKLVAHLVNAQRFERTYIEPSGVSQGILFHHRRQFPDAEILFLVNSSLEHPSTGSVISKLKSVECWDPYTGQTKPFPFAKAGNGLSAKFELPPSGSLLLFLSDKPTNAEFPHETVTTLTSTSPVQIRRLEPNVLTLDFVDITAGGETRKDIYCYQANQFAWKQNGMERDPWDSAVQFKDQLISRKFPANSGFTASYKFTIEGAVPKNLAIVIERPDLYTITCNGHALKAKAKDWWLDKAFGRISIASAACAGENVVILKASPFTMYHELEPAYLLGDFSLKPADKGFLVVPAQPLGLGTVNKAVTHSVNPEGTMWLSSGINFDSGAKDRDDRAPFLVFDLGRTADFSALKIWNYNESYVRDFTSRGARKLRISGAAKDEPEVYVPLGEFELARANGGAALPETLRLLGSGIRYVRFDILSNHNGVSYPATGEPDDNGFVGLAEVQFFAGDQQLQGVKVKRSSSQLPSHQRFARSLTDGSGLSSLRSGWNLQGCPFYSAGVAYQQRFEVPNLAGHYKVALPNWYGSVAKVTVNGKLAGYIDAPPWECDVTKLVKRGANDVQVTVIGTLKNTLGPHHGNPGLGAAWPSAFHVGPSTGLPPGANYSTVAYGLFEPFVLRQVTP
jgi:hypothetical protein